MSYNIEAIFKIKRKQLTKELLAKIIEAIYKNRNYSAPKSQIIDTAEITYEDILGNHVRYTGGLFKNDMPYGCTLDIITNERSRTFIPPLEISDDIAYIVLSGHTTQFEDNRDDKERLNGKALREAFVDDAKSVYSAIHPEWGAIGFDLTIDGLMRSDPNHDPSAFLYPVNFYGPRLAKKVDKKIISKFEPEKLEELDDGGLLIQFGEYLHIAVMRDNKISGEIRMKEMARALATMTGQSVWWKGHEKELGWEE